MIWHKKIVFQITDIKWERIFLHLTVKTEHPEIVRFAFTEFGSFDTEEIMENKTNDVKRSQIGDIVPIDYDSFSDGEYKFVINIAAIHGREFLNNGKWCICAFFDDGFSAVNISNEIAYKLDEMSRIFRYGRGKYAYNLSFSLKSFYGNEVIVYFNSYFMMANRKWKKRKYIQEAFTFTGKLKRTYMFAVIRLIRIFYHIMASITPKDGTRVLFMTETKDYLWGNLKYINDRIIERGLNKQFKLSYSCRKAVGNNKSALSWIKTVYLVAKQDYIFIDDYAPIFGFFKLNPKTELIQVWHAGEGFKSVGYSRFGKDGSPFPSESCHKAYTYALTGSKNLVKVYEEVFGIEKSAFLPIGMARLDDFLDEDYLAKHSSGTLRISEDLIYKIKIFAVLIDDATCDYFFAPGSRSNEEIIEHIKEKALILTKDVNDADKIIALSTCRQAGSNRRTIVIGSLYV